MLLQIYLGDIKICVDQYDTIQRVKDLEKLVSIVDEMKVCLGAGAVVGQSP